MFKTNTYVCFNTSRAVHLTRFGSLPGHPWPRERWAVLPGPGSRVRALDFFCVALWALIQDQLTSGARSTSITQLLRSVQRLGELAVRFQTGLNINLTSMGDELFLFMRPILLN